MQQRRLIFLIEFMRLQNKFRMVELPVMVLLPIILGAARSARMVGYAMNGSDGKDVPAHRVVNRKGLVNRKTSF